MTRATLQKYSANMKKQEALQIKKVEQVKKKEEYNQIDDVIMILYDENIKSETVKKVKCRKELINYLVKRYESIL
jgi:hypothetical protein